MTDMKMMYLLYLLPFLATALTSRVEVDKSCPTCIAFNSTCYNITHVLDIEAPFRNQIVIHKLGLYRSENTIYYSFEPRIEDVEYYKIGFVNLENQNISGVIKVESQKRILNFGTFDIDQDNSRIYFGGTDGIFVLDVNDNKLLPFSSRGDTIKSIFFKSNVYFVKEGDNGITVKKGDNFRTFMESTMVNKFVINKYDFVAYLNGSGLFVGKGDKSFRLSQNPFFRGLNIDLDGTVYAWWIDGIYKIVIQKVLEDSFISKVATLPSIGAMTFDNDNNILFTMDNGLFKMSPTESGCKIIQT